MIGRWWLAGVLTRAFAYAASAADLPVAPGATYYPGVVTPNPYYNWSGFYLGANAGAAWVKQTNTTTDVPTGAFVSTASPQSEGFAGGGQIGGNWFIGPSFVLGVEADFDALTNKTTIIATNGSNQHTASLRFLSTARGRFGLTADRFMIYFTGGGAWGDYRVTRTQITGTVNNAVPGHG